MVVKLTVNKAVNWGPHPPSIHDLILKKFCLGDLKSKKVLVVATQIFLEFSPRKLGKMFDHF